GGGLANTDMRGYSDRRLKRDIKVIPDALDKINHIGGYTFTRVDKDSDKRYAGVLAQEVMEVLPEVVSLDAERDRYAVAYGNLVGL
ncbi:tail fiber domain-containing protein, partial [Enterococcus faecalis]|uniref:tail fiber domain-containing protein n=1 Tax=Enterococcus faecalis TaxID=1351 RepID=UPI00398482F6